MAEYNPQHEQDRERRFYQRVGDLIHAGYWNAVEWVEDRLIAWEKMPHSKKSKLEGKD